MPPTYTTGDVARLNGVPVWQILAAIRRGFLDEPPRVGPFRYWVEADLPRIAAALRAAGYLPTEEVAGAR